MRYGYRNRRPKIQYSIPMHLVQQLPVIREESPTKLYDQDYDVEVLPVRFLESDSYLPEVTSIPRLPPLPTRQRSPLKVDHASLGLLVSDYMNYAREMNHKSTHLAKNDHRQSCWCCIDRNMENLRKNGHHGYGSTAGPAERFVDPLPEIATQVPEVNPTDRWVPRRKVKYQYPDFRPWRAYVYPELWRGVYYNNLEPFMHHAAKSESFYSNQVIDADDSYKSSMKRLRNKVYDIGGL